MIRHMRHGSPPRLMALQSILSLNRRESLPTPSAGDRIRAFIVTPETIRPENRNRVLIHMHGGCYVLNPGEAGLPEAIFMAGLGGYKVISVDYRMPPEAYFPAALEDGMTVLKATQKTTDPKNIAVFGTSAGGALALEMVL